MKFQLKWGFLAACQAFFLPQLVDAKKPQVTENNKNQNVLFIVVDDWGATDLSCKGSKYYETPNIDQLAGQSTNFNNAYVAYPRSVPSRYSLWTGMHCARPQNLEKGAEADERKVDKNTPCIAEPFKASGYNTFFIGKWHLATEDCLPQDKGFEINIGGGKAGATSSHFAPFNQNINPANMNGEGAPIAGMDDAAPGEYLTDYMTRKVVDYIKQDHKKPFLAVCSFYAVHTPIQAKPELIAKYKKKRAEMRLTEDNYIPEEAGVRKAQQNNEVYAAMIESVDQGLGKMIEALKETGQYDNTIIVLISDNGGLSNRGAGNKRELATNNDPFKAGKGHLYEGGIRVPMFIHLPGQTNERFSDVLVAGYDLFPTIADLCNVPLAGLTLDGISMKTAIKGKPDKNLQNRDLYWHKASERPTQTGDYLSSAIRSRNYKLIEFYAQNRVELYDLKNDPGETTNIAEKYPKITSVLLQKVQTWRKYMNVNMPHKAKQDKKNQRTQDKTKNMVK